MKRRNVRKRSISPRDQAKAEAVFQFRPRRAKAQDLRKQAPSATSYKVWLKNPNRTDIKGIDTPDARYVFEHKSPRSQAADLAKRAKKKLPLEVWIKDTARGDLKSPKVDTPKTRHYQVVKKPKADKPAQKTPRKVKVEKAKRKGRKLPNKEEIVQRAKENFMAEQAKNGLPAVTPEEEELKESGAFEKARAELMRNPETATNPAFEQYIGDLRSELEQHGYTIVPVNE